MIRARLADPQPAVSDRLRLRLEAKLAERGIEPAAGPVPDSPEPIPALEAAQSRIPVAYREAMPAHPEVIRWVRAIAESAVAPHAGDLHPHFGSTGRRQVAHGRSLLLWGTTGVGKTHEAFGAIRALTAAGCGVRWHATTAADLYAEMRPRAGVDPEYLLRRIVRVPLLLLDDLGAAKGSEWTEEINFRLLNWRAQNALPTIITSNLPPVRTQAMDPRQPVLRDKVGDRVLSRLSGMCVALEFTGPDRRFQRA
ncbi:ATP-binding protein [Streptomyces mobaraensis]|uniref:ATP-binding protein n=1 Tax=Streptomyces sp. TYQ1024 TaxID=2762559 RepID=UPI00163BD116|nr:MULTISPECIES: ATP-binding protein [Streptomyces]MBC2878105.1 ATP-binding protein [Streptomyces sp. TYQ1024]UBI40049.1 ATP-binding protein [Streptomyces mobaraensis]UKW32629.1 ATP-binding protein [Streptomyces sp. TYQ1024]